MHREDRQRRIVWHGGRAINGPELKHEEVQPFILVRKNASAAQRDENLR